MSLIISSTEVICLPAPRVDGGIPPSRERDLRWEGIVGGGWTTGDVAEGLAVSVGGDSGRWSPYFCGAVENIRDLFGDGG